MRPYLIFAVLGALSLHALAQQQTPAVPKATDPAARVPQAVYRSAFEGYVPYREQAIAPWREVNEEVARAGGHAGIFRGLGHGAQGHPAPVKPATGAPATAATEAGGQAPARGAPKALENKSPTDGHHGH